MPIPGRCFVKCPGIDLCLKERKPPKRRKRAIIYLRLTAMQGDDGNNLAPTPIDQRNTTTWYLLLREATAPIDMPDSRRRRLAPGCRQY